MPLRRTSPERDYVPLVSLRPVESAHVCWCPMFPAGFRPLPRFHGSVWWIQGIESGVAIMTKPDCRMWAAVP